MSIFIETENVAKFKFCLIKRVRAIINAQPEYRGFGASMSVYAYICVCLCVCYVWYSLLFHTPETKLPQCNSI